MYFLALFSILVHGLSIPVLNTAYWLCGVRPLTGDAETIRRRSVHVALPPNSIRADDDTFIAFNRFPRPSVADASTAVATLPIFHHQSDRVPDKGNDGDDSDGHGGGGGEGGHSRSCNSSLRSVVVDVEEKKGEWEDRRTGS